MHTDREKRLKTHDVRLACGPLVLRPMTEADWDILQPWQEDADVLYYTDDEAQTRTLEETQDIWRMVSQSAFVFIVELQGRPVGECWLQEMNLKPVLQRHPGKNLWRIDMAFGDKGLWGKGWGTVMIALLVQFGFERCSADAIFGAGVADYNPRSRRVFEKNGFLVEKVLAQPEGAKAKVVFDLMLARQRYETLGLSPEVFLPAARLPE